MERIHQIETPGKPVYMGLIQVWVAGYLLWLIFNVNRIIFGNSSLPRLISCCAERRGFVISRIAQVILFRHKILPRGVDGPSRGSETDPKDRITPGEQLTWLS